MAALRYYLAEGLRPGVPDVFVAVQAGGFPGLFLEFKRKGGKLSKDQAVWRDRLKNDGYAWLLPWTGEEALRMVAEYFKGRYG